jgi:hypothetical protein
MLSTDVFASGQTQHARRLSILQVLPQTA